MRSNKISWPQYKFAECFLEEKICSFPHCPEKIWQKLSICEAFSVTNQSHSLAGWCFCNITLEKCSLHLPPSETSKVRQWFCQEQHWVLAGLCLWQWGCFSAAFHPQDDASLISLSWGWRGRIERFRKVSKTECWRELGVFSSREDPALLLNHLELLCSERHCRGCPQQGDHKGPWESPVELHPCVSAWP